MSSRKINEAPSFTLIESLKEKKQIEMEMKKIVPLAEISIEGLSDIAKGRIVEWDPPRKLFTVKWDKKSDAFDKRTESEINLRTFFKCSLFSTQLVFKTSTVRRLDDGNFQYRIPIEIFKQQKRGALRVPITAGTASLHCNEGDFEIADLSIGGAKLRTYAKGEPAMVLTGCELNLNGYRIRVPGFTAKVTRQEKEFIACKFEGLDEAVKTEIKQYLIEALRIYYEEVL